MKFIYTINTVKMFIVCMSPVDGSKIENILHSHLILSIYSIVQVGYSLEFWNGQQWTEYKIALHIQIKFVFVFVFVYDCVCVLKTFVHLCTCFRCDPRCSYIKPFYSVVQVSCLEKYQYQNQNNDRKEKKKIPKFI